MGTAGVGANPALNNPASTGSFQLTMMTAAPMRTARVFGWMVANNGIHKVTSGSVVVSVSGVLEKLHYNAVTRTWISDGVGYGVVAGTIRAGANGCAMYYT
jgi:hypothetical protein